MTSAGFEGLFAMPEFGDFDIVFDASSAGRAAPRPPSV